MRRAIFVYSFVLWPLFLGVFLPYCEFPGGLHLMNVFWEVIYGLALWLADELGVLSLQSPWFLVGVFLWPIIISCAMFMIGYRIEKLGSNTLRRGALIALIASSVFIIKWEWAMQPSWVSVPNYHRVFGAYW